MPGAKGGLSSTMGLGVWGLKVQGMMVLLIYPYFGNEENDELAELLYSTNQRREMLYSLINPFIYPGIDARG